MGVQVLAILIPALATVLVAAIGAVVTIGGRKREAKVTEIYEAFDERGQLVTSLKERLELVTTQRDEANTRADKVEKKCSALEREVDELHEMVKVPRKKAPRRRS